MEPGLLLGCESWLLFPSLWELWSFKHDILPHIIKIIFCIPSLLYIYNYLRTAFYYFMIRYSLDASLEAWVPEWLALLGQYWNRLIAEFEAEEARLRKEEEEDEAEINKPLTDEEKSQKIPR
jgi:hypothetical protein